MVTVIPHHLASGVSRAAPLAFALLQILTPVLPSLGIGEPIGDRSDSVRSLITPAGWAFSIWGALYTGSLVFALFQALPGQRDNPLLARLRWPAAGAFFGNALWALYTQTFGLSAISSVIILFTLACLLVIFRTFAIWPTPFAASERWCAVLPLSALASWLTAASIVNISASLRFHEVEGGEATPMIAAAVVVGGGIIAAATLLRGRGNPPYALVFLWALSAIYAAGGQREHAVAVAAMLAGVLVIIATLVALRRGGGRHWFTAARQGP
ncbi:MAG: hypothetical protein EOP60_15950 [Sphingomonadales bacterium]|nr:MAG: hypothetical protein EOP60_15950 [Sphingomonadales bacterium]